MDIVVPADHKIKLKESEKKDKYLDLARELKKPWNMKVIEIPIAVGAYWNNPQRTGKGTRRLGNKRKSGHHPDYSFIKIGQNIDQSPGDLRRLGVAQTPVKTINQRWCKKNSQRSK